MPTRLLLACAVVCACLVCAVPAGAASKAAASKAVWTTVNVCDTKKAPDTIGLRASMPGMDRKGAKMRMRFQVQYRGADLKWTAGKGLDTGFLSIGSARVKSREAGHSFRVKPPSKGGSYLMRGYVSFEWRSKGGKLLSSKQRITEAGHKSTAGADPAGYSAATCTIKG